MNKQHSVPVRKEQSRFFDPFFPRPFYNLRDEIDRIFDAFEPDRIRNRWLTQQGPADVAATPVIDVASTEDGYEITAELPGLAPEQIEVFVQDGVLTIQGEKSETSETGEEGRVVSERRYGAFRRALQLPGDLDEQKLEARVANGVLTIRAPKSQQAEEERRRIEVKTA